MVDVYAVLLTFHAHVGQEDHSMWMESLLFHTLPATVGEFLHNYTMPFFGEPTSAVEGLHNGMPILTLIRAATMPSALVR